MKNQQEGESRRCGGIWQWCLEVQATPTVPAVPRLRKGEEVTEGGA